MLRYELVPAPALAVGDRIISHGGMFRVREVIVSTTHDTASGPTHANICDYEGDAPGYGGCAIPVSWRKDWNEQGNARHRVARITA